MILYKATNTITKDFYIGITKNKLEQRRNKHFYDMENGRKTYFINALKKYGVGVFHWEIILRNCPNWKELCEKEIEYISNLKPAYNMTKGGDGVTGRTKESRERQGRNLSKYLTGRKKETCPRLQKVGAKLSKRYKGLTKETSPLFKKISETLSAPTEKNRLRNLANSLRQKGQTKENTEWRARQAKTITGRTKETHPYLKQRGAAYSARFKGIITKGIIYSAEARKYKVNQIKDGIIIKTWESLKEAMEGMGNTNIHSAIKNKWKAGGYNWERVEKNE